jgi:two-component system chemotaxis response regulator CheB
VDVLFNSVASEAKNQSVGIILTGMGYDGAKGLLAMRKEGARTIGQDQNSSVVYGMPKVAYDIGAVEYQMPLRSIANMINIILRER